MKLLILVICFFLGSTTLKADSENEIVGKWQSGHGSGRVEIYKKGDKFFGKLIWLKDPYDEDGKPLTDIHNPDQSLKGRPIIGIDLFKNLSYKGNNVWGGGTVYDPKSGKTYNCQMSLRNEKELDIRAFFGIALIGKTETWTRVN